MAFVSLFPVPRAARGLAELCELCSHVIIPSIQACFCYITILINVLITSNLNTHTSCLDANCGIHLHHINSSHDLPCATHFFCQGLFVQSTYQASFMGSTCTPEAYHVPACTCPKPDPVQLFITCSAHFGFNSQNL